MKTKKCPRCNKVKPTNLFSKDNMRKGGLQRCCKLCNSDYHKQHFKNPDVKEQHRLYNLEYIKNNKENRNAYLRKYRKIDEVRKRIQDKKKDKCRKRKVSIINSLGGRCCKCGIKYNGKNSCIFQLHHRNPKEKETTIAHAVNCYSDKRLELEVKKCDLLCANCHFIVHVKN